jgi:AcrR family transcriptional regulator
VRAALALLARSGVAAVSVERLARQLKVTKGSFYWHFEDRAELLKAALEHWQRVSTTLVMARVEALGGTAASRLRALLTLAASHARAASLEQAVRAWGGSDSGVRRVLQRVDRQRAQYVMGLLVEAGVPRLRASLRAEGLYLTLVGEYAVVSRGGPRTPPAVWEAWISLALTGGATGTRGGSREATGRRPR